LHAFSAFKPKNAFCPVNACKTPAVTGYVPLAEVEVLAEPPPVPLDPLEEQPAAVIEAVTATAQAASHRCFLSVITVRLPSAKFRHIARMLVFIRRGKSRRVKS
jgi:hypothetical protein